MLAASVSLRRLRYFVTVAEEGGISRAAARLGIQQPPLSQQVRKLEDELGVVLFERSPKQIRLNSAGRMFLAQARSVLEVADAAVERVRRFDRGEVGELGIGFTSSASLHHLAPALLHKFLAAYPEVSVQVEESPTHELLEKTVRGRIDAAFVRVPLPPSEALAALCLDSEPMLLAAPASHRLASSAKPADLRAIAREPLIMYRMKEGRGIYEELMDAFRAKRVEPRIVSETTRMIAALNLVAAGRGLTFVPASMRGVHPELIRYLPMAEGQLPPSPLTLAYRRDNDSPTLRTFLQTVQAGPAEV